jgi:hypothetical protein
VAPKSIGNCRSQDTRPEAHERKREWMDAEEALRRIRAWYADPAKFPDASRPFAVESIPDTSPDAVKRSKEEKKARKRDSKGGAMQTALEAFLRSQGW